MYCSLNLGKYSRWKREECMDIITPTLSKKYGDGLRDLTKDQLKQLEKAYDNLSKNPILHQRPSIYIRSWESFDTPRYRIYFKNSKLIIEKCDYPWTNPYKTFKETDTAQISQEILNLLDSDHLYSVVIGYCDNIFSWSSKNNINRIEVMVFVLANLSNLKETRNWN